MSHSEESDSIFFCCGYSGTALVFGSGESVVNISDSSPHSFNNKIEFLRDPEGSLTIRDIQTRDAEFVPVRAFPALGFTRDVGWFRFHLNRDLSAPASWVLKLAPSYLDHAYVWLQHNGQIIARKDIGRRDGLAHGYILPDALQTLVNLPEGQTTVLYPRPRVVRTVALRPVLLQPEELLRNNEINTFKLGLFSGGMLLVFLFNLMCWLVTREQLYGLFSGYVGFGLLAVMDGSGLIGSYIWPDWYSLPGRSLTVFICVTWIFGQSFFVRLYVPRKRYPMVYWLQVSLISTAAVGGLSGLSAGYAYSYLAELLTILGVLAGTLTLWPVWNIIRENPSHSELALALAYIPHALFLIPNVLFTAGLLPPSLFNILGLVQGSLIQIAILQIAMLFLLRDIQLERNQAVEKAIKTDTLLDKERKVQQEQSRFLSMITHEIRTPLAVIDMAVQSLRTLDGNTEKARETRYSRIQSAVKRMATLMELGLKKDGITAKVWSPDDQVDLIKLTQQLEKDFPADEVARIELDCKTETAEITGNSAALKLTFFNLVENALKYSGDNLSVKITVARNNHHITWQVDDSGSGIPKGQRLKIFEKFHRAGETSSKPGLGLGLYIVKEVIDRHGGRIDCTESELGGACFRCVFTDEL